MGKALVLVGHGSARNPNTKTPLTQAVEAIASMKVYDEVTCAFLKEDVRICKSLNDLESDDVTVVPFFIADGYYTQGVIPCCLKKNMAREGRKVRYTKAVGSHPLFAELIMKHAEAAGWSSGDALVVMGHGTPKNPASGINVYVQAERIRSELDAAEELLTTFIDEAPFITDVWDLTRAENIVVIPLFIGNGWHVTETIPDDLGLDERFVGHKNQRRLTMATAVGTDPGITNVILEIAQEAERTS